MGIFLRTNSYNPLRSLWNNLKLLLNIFNFKIYGLKRVYIFIEFIYNSGILIIYGSLIIFLLHAFVKNDWPGQTTIISVQD